MKIWLPAIRAGSGADVFTLRMAEGLREAGHEPVIQWFSHRFELMPWALKGVSPPAGTDVVQAGSWQGFAFKRSGMPLVVTEHHYIWHPEFDAHRSASQRLYHQFFIDHCLSRTYAAADCLVAVSQNTAMAMRQNISRAVLVIPNWVNTDQFSPRKCVAERSAGDRFRVIFVGNPSRWKGADLLSRYAALLGSEIELGCLGGLRRDMSASEMLPNMISVPRVEPKDMPDLYRAADAVVVLARYEAFGYVALEAMSCGLPVLGFDTTGTSEVCVHGETALLAPVGDLDMLVEHTRQLIRQPELRARLGAAGRSRAVECFNEERAISQYVGVYEKLLMARGKT